MSVTNGKSILDKVGKNSFFATGTTIITAVGGLITSVFLARYLGAEEYGKYSYLLWIVGIFALFANFGLPNTVVKYIAEFNATSSGLAYRFFKNVVRLELILSVTCSLIIIVWGVCTSDVGLLYFAALLLVPQSLGRVLSSVAHGLQKYKITATTRLLITPVQVGLLWILLATGRGVAEILTLMALTEVIQCLIINSAIKRKLSVHSDISAIPSVNWRKVISFSSSVFFLTLLDAVVWQKSEVFFLKYFLSMQAVAVYSLSYGLTYMIMQVPVTLTNVLFPVFSEAYGVNADDVLRRGYYYSIKYLMLMILPLITFLVVIMPQIVKILYGEQYLSAVEVIRILLVVSAIATIHRPISTTLYSTENQHFIIKITIILAIINIILDVIMIPDYGVVGAAIANGAVQLGSVIWGLLFINRKFNYPYPLMAGVKIAASCLLVSIPFLLLQSMQNHVIYLLLCCCCFPVLFLGLMFLFRPLNEKTDTNIFTIIEKKMPIRYRWVIVAFRRCLGIAEKGDEKATL